MTELDTRYGRSPERRRRNRVIAIVAAVLGALVVVAWAAWAGVLSPQKTLESRVVGYTVVAEDLVVLRYEVSATPGSSVVCALAARNEDHETIAWKVVELPPSDDFTRSFEERLITSEPADVGLISECRLT